ncbi:hypothetical protein FKM82_019099 [Ascaphus truei]
MLINNVFSQHAFCFICTILSNIHTHTHTHTHTSTPHAHTGTTHSTTHRYYASICTQHRCTSNRCCHTCIETYTTTTNYINSCTLNRRQIYRT